MIGIIGTVLVVVVFFSSVSLVAVVAVAVVAAVVVDTVVAVVVAAVVVVVVVLVRAVGQVSGIMAQTFFEQHSHIVNDTYSTCSLGVNPTRAGIIALCPCKQNVLSPK
jgi:hypothetical protein